MELWLVYKGLERVLGDNQREGVCGPHNPNAHKHAHTHILTQERDETGAPELLSRQRH